MNKNERAIIELSLKILEDARDRAPKEMVDTLPFRLALRCLRPHMKEQWPLHSSGIKVGVRALPLPQ